MHQPHHAYQRSHSDNFSLAPVYQRLAHLSNERQWILITSECPRPNIQLLSAYQIRCHKVIQLKSSRIMNEYEVVVKAICSGNASAILTSDQLSQPQRAYLLELAQAYQCEVFFTTNSRAQYH